MHICRKVRLVAVEAVVARHVHVQAHVEGRGVRGAPVAHHEASEAHLALQVARQEVVIPTSEASKALSKENGG